ERERPQEVPRGAIRMQLDAAVENGRRLRGRLGRIVPWRRHGLVTDTEGRLVHAVDAEQAHLADALDDDVVPAGDFGDLLRMRGRRRKQENTCHYAPPRPASTHAASVDDRPRRAAVIVRAARPWGPPRQRAAPARSTRPGPPPSA